MRFPRTIVIAALLLAIPACHESPSLALIGCLAITDRSTCVVPVTDAATATLELDASLDAAFAQQYTCTGLVEGQGLSSPVALSQAKVEVVDPTQGDAVLVQFTAPLTGSVDPGTGLGTTDIELVDPITVQSETTKILGTGHEQQVVVRVVVLGREADGTELSTPELDYPVQISFGASCVAASSQPCISGTTAAAPDCRLGVDEPAGTSCQAIAAMLGPCHTLECDVDATTGKSDLTTAHCAVHVPADDSCCNP